MSSADVNLPDVNRGPVILAVCSTLTLLALVVVCMRILVRTKMIHKVGPDDYAIIVAMALSFSGMCIVIPEVRNGAGRHIGYLEPTTASKGLKLNFATQPIYLWTITTVKVSIALFLLRISPTQFYRRMLNGIIAFLIVYTFICFLTIMLQCKNIAVLWDSTVKTTCWTVSTIRGLGYLNTGLNISTDILFAFLPIPMLWNVQINDRTKASLTCILGLGIFACAAAIVKLSYLPNYGKSGDFLWDSASLTIWTVTESNTGIIAACLPCLKPLFRHILETSRGYGSKSGYGPSKGNGHSLHTFRQGDLSRSKANNSVVTTKNLKSQSEGDLDLEDNSSENFLPLQTGSTIMKTVSVTVNSCSASSGRRSVSRGNDVALERKVEDRV